VLSFIIRRLGVMALTMLCLTLVVFFLINLEPNLRKLAISQLDMRSSAADQERWLERNGYRQNFFVRYGQWLGVMPKQPNFDPGTGQAENG
jgi:peptide/nickel transport system permease protein